MLPRDRWTGKPLLGRRSLMVDKNTMVYGRKPRASWWTIVAGLVAAVVFLPIAAVFWIAVTPAENIWPHLWNSVLPRYLTNTVVLVVGVGVLSGAIGAGAAIPGWRGQTGAPDPRHGLWRTRTG